MTVFDPDMNRLVSAEKSSEDGWSAVNQCAMIDG